MIRVEFSRKTKALIRQRANDRCENPECPTPEEILRDGQFHYDHITPDALSHDNRLDNCRLLCVACHRTKTTGDMAAIGKSNRIRRKHSEHLARLAEKGKL